MGRSLSLSICILRKAAQVGFMMYVFYGSVAILLWKCGSQLMSEAQYKPLYEEDPIKAKSRGQRNGSDGKYTTIIY